MSKLAIWGLVFWTTTAFAQENCQDLWQIHASGSVTLADRSDIKGSIYGSVVDIGNDSRFVGMVEAPNRVRIGDRTTYQGTLFYSSQINIGNQVFFDGDSASTASVSSCLIPLLSTQSSEQSIEVPNDGSLELVPGVYGDLIVRSRASLELSSGVYYFKSVIVESDAHVEWTSAPDESIQWIVIGSVRLADRSDMNGDVTLNLQAGGSIDIGTDSRTRINFITPTGDLRVASRTLLNGRLLAKNIRLEPDVVAFGRATIRPDLVVDSYLLNPTAEITRKDFQQLAFRSQNPEAVRSGEQLSNIQRKQMVELYTVPTDSGYSVPMQSYYKPIRMQLSGSSETRILKASYIQFPALDSGMVLTLTAPAPLQELDGVNVHSWLLTLEGQTLELLPDSSVDVHLFTTGAQSLRIVTRLASGEEFLNIQSYEVVGKQEEEEELP